MPRDLCDERGIRQESTTPGTAHPKRLGRTRTGAYPVAAAAFEAPWRLPETRLPASDALWAETCMWSCKAFNRTVTTVKPGNKTPRELYFESPPPLTMRSFPKSGYGRVHQDHKAAPKGELCFYLDNGSNHPHDSVQVILPPEKVTYTRDIKEECPREPFF